MQAIEFGNQAQWSSSSYICILSHDLEARLYLVGTWTTCSVIIASSGISPFLLLRLSYTFEKSIRRDLDERLTNPIKATDGSPPLR